MPLLEERGWRFVFWTPAPSDLHDHLRALGHDARGAPRQLAYSLRALRLPPGPRARLAGMPRYVRAFRRALREVAPDLVHANSLTAIAEAALARAGGVPTVFHVHEMVTGGRKGRAAARAASAVATELVGVSQACADALASGSRRPRVVYESAPLPSAPRPATADGAAMIVGSVGVISRRKGSDLFVEAARLVGERTDAVRFRLVGAPTDPLDADWAEGVLTRARDAGVEHLPRADVAALLNEWDIFALPSRRDPCPISLIEAMGAGLAVVGTRVDGIVEQIAPGTGVLVEPDSPAALADAILELHEAGAAERARLGAAARERAAEVFSPERQAEGIHAAYLAALAGR